MKDSERVLDPIEARANPERGVPGMTGAESCPDCGARLPAGSPSGLCPFCLLRLGAALSAELAQEIGSEASSDVRQPAGEDRGFRVAGDRVEQGSCARGQREHPPPRCGRGRAAGPARLAGDAGPLGTVFPLPAHRRAGTRRDGGDLPGARPQPRARPRRQGNS